MKTKLLIALPVVAGLALAAGWWLGRQHAETTPAASSQSAREVLYWYDPMAPDKHFPKPGKSPFMDMQLLPKYADEVSGGGVRVDPVAAQNLGMRVAAIEPRVLNARIEASANVDWDLRSEQRLDAAVAARVVRLWARAPFEPVRAGAPLVELEAPEWASAIAEYLALRRARSADGKALIAAARSRLLRLGLGEADIRAAEQRGQHGRSVVLHAPIDGLLVELPVRVGQWLRPGEMIARLNRLDQVWLLAAPTQAQAARLQAGDSVAISLDALPGQALQGRIEQVLPAIDPRTRTQQVRIVLANPQHALVPGQFARVALQVADSEPALWVPDEALILDGREARLALAEDEGRYRIVAVRTGRRAQGHTEIVEGLAAGARVVLSGQFLLDSESSLGGVAEPEPDAEAHAGHGAQS